MKTTVRTHKQLLDKPVLFECYADLSLIRMTYAILSYK